MRCKYCGGEIPPPRPGGSGSQKTVYCSFNCSERYRSLKRYRQGQIPHCEFCGHVILRGKCPRCSQTGGKQLNGGLTYLVLAIFRQAIEDGALGEMIKNGTAAELTGADPGYIRRLYMKGETT